MSLPKLAAENEGIKEALDGPTGHKEVAEWITGRGYKTSETSVRRYRTKVGWDTPPTPIIDDAILDFGDIPDRDFETENDELRAANRRLFKTAAALRNKREAYTTTLYNAVRDAFENTPALPAPKPPKDSRRNKEEVALWHLTDWQLGKQTATYNTEVGIERVQKCVQKFQRITEVMRADHPVRHGIVLMTGDMLEGCNIFPAQEWELDSPLFEQIVNTVALEEFVVNEALKTYDTVDVICEWGNHGRIGKKSDGFKPSDNVDRIIYEFVRQKFEDEPRINNFQLSDQFYQHFTVGAYSAIAIHGDEIKSFGGNTPSYGILRKANAWASGVVEEFRDMYIGHYHQSMELSMANGGSVYMSGSTESGNEYAREFVAATNEPSQRINFIDPEEGFVTYSSRVWL